MSDQFKPGDVVRSTISDEPPMTVDLVEDGLVSVVWFDENDELCRGVWNACYLMPARTVQ